MLSISTAADSKYFLPLLNLIGSLERTNSFSLIVYDLGLSSYQLKLLVSCKNVSRIKKLDTLSQHSSNPYVAKCLIWNEMSKDCGKQLFLDAGLMICRDLSFLDDSFDGLPLLALPSSFTNSYCTPKDFFDKYSLDMDFNNKQELGSGFIYFDFDNIITKDIVNFSKKMALEGDVEGWSKAEQHRNHGLAKSDKIRDCYLFRHDETALNVSTYQFDRSVQPLASMHLFNHCYKYEYIDQYIYTFRRRNRAPALKYVIPTVPLGKRWRLIPSILKNIYAYAGLTIKRNLTYILPSDAYKKLIELSNKIEFKKIYIIRDSDIKYSYNHKKSVFLIDNLSDSRLFRFDTFKYLLRPQESSSAIKIDSSCLKSIDINESCIIVIDSISISMSVVAFLSDIGVPFFVRTRSVSVDDAYYNSFEIIKGLRDSYILYDDTMNNVFVKYDYDDLFTSHPRENHYQPMFHDKEVVELLFIPKRIFSHKEVR